jgi:F-type H+-transporting ATPase subunit a
MDLSSDSTVVFTLAGIAVDATIVWSWVVMALLVVVSIAATRHLTTDFAPSRWQNFLEALVGEARRQIGEVSHHDPGPYLPFVATLFVFIAVSNLLTIVPGYVPPTATLSTTAALALCVLVAVPLYGIAERGFWGYLREYAQPTIFMLPFNIIGEFSRTIALAVRLYGNAMSGVVLAGILIAVAPFLFPIVLTLLGLLTGFIQAYIFSVLAMVYIASATRARHGNGTPSGETSTDKGVHPWNPTS